LGRQQEGDLVEGQAVRQAGRARRGITKGQWVTVSGVPSVATWTGRDGTKQSTPEVEAGSWSWVGPKQEDRGQQDDRGRDDQGGRNRADEIPF
jgi:hypothetical protein